MQSKSPKIFSTLINPNDLDLALGHLSQFNFTTFEQKGLKGKIQLTAQIPSSLPVDFLRRLAKLKNQITHRPIFLCPQFKVLKDHPWEKEYLKYLSPFTLSYSSQNQKASFRIRIDPRGKIPKIKKINTLYLEPSLAFGTGTHPTTRMAAQILCEVVIKNKSKQVLDLGCGTGILAMIACKAGALRVEAIDNDPVALEVARRNFTLNRIQKIKLGLSLKKSRKKYEVVIANILLTTLIELKNEIAGCLQKKGYLILSGLLYKDVKPIVQAYADFTLLERKNHKGWSALLFQFN